MDLSKITDIEERKLAAKLWTELIAAQDELGNAGGQGFSDEERAAFDALQEEYDIKAEELEEWFSARKKEIFGETERPPDPALEAAAKEASDAFDALERNDVFTDVETEEVLICAMSGVPLWEDDEVLRGEDGTLVLRCLLELPHAPEPEAEVADDEEVAA